MSEYLVNPVRINNFSNLIVMLLNANKESIKLILLSFHTVIREAGSVSEVCKIPYFANPRNIGKINCIYSRTHETTIGELTWQNGSDITFRTWKHMLRDKQGCFCDTYFQ